MLYSYSTEDGEKQVAWTCAALLQLIVPQVRRGLYWCGAMTAHARH